MSFSVYLSGRFMSRNNGWLVMPKSGANEGFQV
jgi:hypothetical protein